LGAVERTVNLLPTPVVRVAQAKRLGAEPIAGYRLIAPLGSGGFGEVWKCRAPGEILKAIKFVHGPAHPLGTGDDRLQRELDAVRRVKDIRHPYLLSLERVEVVGSELVVVMELADGSLYDLLTERRQAGEVGIPRRELLRYLGEAAEVLDLMNVEYHLQHLDVKPHNLLLLSHHVKVADFGLVHDVGTSEEGRSRGATFGGISPCYAAPEVFRNHLSPHSDQYSLAITYHELLTGVLPFFAKSLVELARKHTQEEPDLSHLPAPDRPVVARALAKDPRQRFASCTEFVHALVGASPPTPPEVEEPQRPASAGSSPLVQANAPWQLVAASRPRPYGEIDVSRLRRGGIIPQEPPGNEAPTLVTHEGLSEAAVRAGLSPGYRIQSCRRRGSCTEEWTVRDHLDQEHLVRIYQGTADRKCQAEQGLIPELTALRHPALPPVKVLRWEPSRLVLLTEPVGKTLRQRFEECQSRKKLGIPREELLDYLMEAAEALDQLFELYGVRHLWLHPHRLLLTPKRLRLADFGIAQLCWLGAGPPRAWLHPRYAPPELFEGTVGPSCDAYSLAAIYAEMLTGIHPLRGHSLRSPVAARRKRTVNLDLVPSAQRSVLARALDPDPDRRFPSCVELIDALSRPTEHWATAVETPAPTLVEARPPLPEPPWADWGACHEQVLAAIIKAAAGSWHIQKSGPLHLRLRPGELLEHHCHTRGPSALMAYKLESFCTQWQTRLEPCGEGRFTFRLATLTGFWQRWLGRQPGLRVTVQLTPSPSAPGLTEIHVQMAPSGCRPAEGAQLLRDFGPVVLESLRAALLVGPERRAEERLPWHAPVQVLPVFHAGQVGEAIACQAKDISPSGIGLSVPHPLPTARVLIELPPLANTPAVQVGGTLVNQQKRPDGWTDTGVLLHKGDRTPASILTRD
jgi:serine/threonine protein kinase